MGHSCSLIQKLKIIIPRLRDSYLKKISRKAYTLWGKLNPGNFYLARIWGESVSPEDPCLLGLWYPYTAVQLSPLWLQRAGTEPQLFSDGIVTFPAASKFTQNYIGRNREWHQVTVKDTMKVRLSKAQKHCWTHKLLGRKEGGITG